MRYKLRFSADALADLSKHNRWYELKRPGLGARFSEAISEQTKLVTAAPELYKKHYRDVHRCSVRKFPYEIFYRINGETVVILAVHGVRQDPQKIEKRLSKK